MFLHALFTLDDGHTNVKSQSITDEGRMNWLRGSDQAFRDSVPQLFCGVAVTRDFPHPAKSWALNELESAVSVPV